MLLLSVVPARPHPLDVINAQVLVAAPYLKQISVPAKTPIVLDSGGYQLLNSRRLTLEQAKQVYKQALALTRTRKLNVHYVLQLDVPPASEDYALVKLNVDLYKWSIKVAEEYNLEVVPIIHGTPGLVDKYLEIYRNIDFIAIGGLVPVARKRPRLAIEIVRKIIASLGPGRVHLLGLFMPTLLDSVVKVAHELGVKLIVDYVGWRRAGAMGLVLTPWGYRKITGIGKNSHAPNPNKIELEYIHQVCTKYNLSVEKLATDFVERAKFNICSALEIAKLRGI